MRAILNRRYEKNQTLGMLVIMDNGEIIFTCRTLELKWMGNVRDLSCIPEGKYKVEKNIRPSGKPGLWIKDVPNRTSILIHSGNFASGNAPDIEGCILVGADYKDINGDGNLDIIASTSTFGLLFHVLPREFELEIFN